MWLSLLVVAAAAVTVYFEVPKLWRQKKKKEIVVFSSILSVGVLLNILLFSGIRVPSPLEAIVYLFHPVVKSLYRMLA